MQHSRECDCFAQLEPIIRTGPIIALIQGYAHMDLPVGPELHIIAKSGRVTLHPDEADSRDKWDSTDDEPMSAIDIHENCDGWIVYFDGNDMDVYSLAIPRRDDLRIFFAPANIDAILRAMRNSAGHSLPVDLIDGSFRDLCRAARAFALEWFDSQTIFARLHGLFIALKNE